MVIEIVGQLGLANGLVRVARARGKWSVCSVASTVAAFRIGFSVLRPTVGSTADQTQRYLEQPELRIAAEH